MISLKNLIESNQQEWVQAALSAYCSALDATVNSGIRACPPQGTQWQLGLWALRRQLSDNATLSGARETQRRLESELSQWGEHSAEYYKGKTEDFNEIVMIMARTAEAVGDRDQRYSTQLTEFTRRLRSQGQGAPRKLTVNASIGIAVWKDGDTMAELFVRADREMYQERHAGKRQEVKTP